MKAILFTFFFSCSVLAAQSTLHKIIPVDLDKGAKLVSLQTGEALLIGSIVQKFDPQTLKWQKFPPLRVPRRWGHALTLDNGKVLVMGGVSLDEKSPVDIPEIYDPNTGTSVLGAPLNGLLGKTPVAQISASKVLVLGMADFNNGWGYCSNFILDLSDFKIELPPRFKSHCPDGPNWYKLASGNVMGFDDQNLPDIFDMTTMSLGGFGASDGDKYSDSLTGITASGRVFIVSGDFIGGGKIKLMEFDESNFTWKPIADMKNPRRGQTGSEYRQIARAFGLPDGRYVFFSYRYEKESYDGDVYDPKTNSWSSLPPVISKIDIYSGRGHQIISLGSGKGLLLLLNDGATSEYYSF